MKIFHDPLQFGSMVLQLLKTFCYVISFHDYLKNGEYSLQLLKSFCCVVILPDHYKIVNIFLQFPEPFCYFPDYFKKANSPPVVLIIFDNSITHSINNESSKNESYTLTCSIMQF